MFVHVTNGHRVKLGKPEITWVQDIILLLLLKQTISCKCTHKWIGKIFYDKSDLKILNIQKCISAATTAAAAHNRFVSFWLKHVSKSGGATYLD